MSGEWGSKENRMGGGNESFKISDSFHIDLSSTSFGTVYSLKKNRKVNILICVPHLCWEYVALHLNFTSVFPPTLGFMLEVWSVPWQAAGHAKVFPVSWTRDQVSPFPQHLLVLFNRKWGPSERLWPRLSQNGPWQAGILACDCSQ